MLAALFSTILAMSLAGSALWLILRLIRPATDKLCSARWGRGSRLLVLLAFLFPFGLCLQPAFSPPSTMTVPAALSPSGGIATLPPAWTMLAPQNRQAPFSLPAAAAVLWLAGALTAAVFLFIRQRRFLARLRRTALPVEDTDALTALCGELGLRQPPALFTSDWIRSPLGAGLFRPALYLPEIPLEPGEWQLILRHELIHLRRRDLWLKWCVLCSLVLHWFNPLAWAFAREWGLTCEISCDETVVSGLSLEERRYYGDAILTVLSRTAPPEDGVCASFCGGHRGLKRRLRHILRPGHSPRGQRACTLLAALILCILLPFTASVQAWAAPCQSWGSADAYQAQFAKQALEYLPLGISYDALTNRYFYQGEAVSMLLDEYPPNAAELEGFPGLQKIRRCFYRNVDDSAGPALRVVRDAERKLLGVVALTKQERFSHLIQQTSVCYDGYQTGENGSFYANDPAWENIPADIRNWAVAVPKGETAALLNDSGGYLCYGGLYCPWRLEVVEGVLRVNFYPSPASDPSRPCVIHYSAQSPPIEIQFYVDGVFIRSQ